MAQDALQSDCDTTPEECGELIAHERGAVALALDATEWGASQCTFPWGW